MKSRILLFMLLLGVGSSWADTLYKCQNTEGRTTYTNQKTGKNCEIISQDKPVSSIGNAPKSGGATKQPTPADFPRVAGDQQKARDTDRRAILEQELANEQRNQDAARKTLSEQENLTLPEERVQGGAIQGGKRDERIKGYRDKVQLHDRNIESLRREINNLK